MPSWLPKEPSWLRENALCLSQSAFSNFPLHVIIIVIVVHCLPLKACGQPQLNPFIRQCKFCLTFKWLLTSFLFNHKRYKLSLFFKITQFRSISTPSPFPVLPDDGNYTLTVPLNISKFKSCALSLAMKFVCSRTGLIVRDGDRQSWDPRAPMIWDGISTSKTNCAIVMSYIRANPHTYRGFWRGYRHLPWVKRNSLADFSHPWQELRWVNAVF